MEPGWGIWIPGTRPAEVRTTGTAGYHKGCGCEVDTVRVHGETLLVCEACGEVDDDDVAQDQDEVYTCLSCQSYHHSPGLCDLCVAEGRTE